jgi:hypothetical protein
LFLREKKTLFYYHKCIRNKTLPTLLFLIISFFLDGRRTKDKGKQEGIKVKLVGIRDRI